MLSISAPLRALEGVHHVFSIKDRILSSQVVNLFCIFYMFYVVRWLAFCCFICIYHLNYLKVTLNELNEFNKSAQIYVHLLHV